MTKILIGWCQDTLVFFSPHHAVWDECNKRRHESRRDHKEEEKRNGAGLWHVTIPPQISWHHILPERCFALHAELIAVWFSTDMHLHTNAGVTNLSVCPLSRGRKQCDECTRLILRRLSEPATDTPSITSSSYSNIGGSCRAMRRPWKS